MTGKVGQIVCILGKRTGDKKLLVGVGSTVYVDKVPMQEEFEEDQVGDTGLDKKL